MGGDTTYIAERHGPPATNTQEDKNTQQYTLYPNPNAGNLILLQKIADTQPVATEIWDAMGRNINKQNLTFTGGSYNLQLGRIAPGVLIQMRDSIGRSFEFKFVVE